jgi:hypothetical protein
MKDAHIADIGDCVDRQRGDQRAEAAGSKPIGQFIELEKPQSNTALDQENEGVGTRTQDLRIKSPLLYQLSYAF